MFYDATDFMAAPKWVGGPTAAKNALLPGAKSAYLNFDDNLIGARIRQLNSAGDHLVGSLNDNPVY
jgi:hypothetical protein